MHPAGNASCAALCALVGWRCQLPARLSVRLSDCLVVCLPVGLYTHTHLNRACNLRLSRKTWPNSTSSAASSVHIKMAASCASCGRDDGVRSAPLSLYVPVPRRGQLARPSRAEPGFLLAPAWLPVNCQLRRGRVMLCIIFWQLLTFVCPSPLPPASPSRTITPFPSCPLRPASCY